MKLACIDIGLKRIGLAITLDGKNIFPQDAIIRRNREQAAHDVRDALKEWDIEKLVVGLPLDGSSSAEMQRRIEHFVSLLQLDIPVVYQDEQNSSQEAKERSVGIFKNRRDGKIDSIAASIILERYLGIL
jgi:putative holliday junction resolvase